MTDRMTWMGRPLEDLSKEELIAAVELQAQKMRELSFTFADMAELVRLSHVRQAKKSHVPWPFRAARR